MSDQVEVIFTEKTKVVEPCPQKYFNYTSIYVVVVLKVQFEWSCQSGLVFDLSLGVSPHIYQ